MLIQEITILISEGSQLQVHVLVLRLHFIHPVGQNTLTLHTLLHFTEQLV